MVKPTKRKAFNFLRSYFDVFNELESDADKLNFLTSIINKQFLDESPKDLNFIVNLCYESQRHQIESSVKGWERASSETLATTPPTTPSAPWQEEEVKEEEKEKGEVKEQGEQAEFLEKYPFNEFWDYYDKKTSDKNKCKKKFEALPEKDKEQIFITLVDYKKSTPEKQYRKNPETYLNNRTWEHEILTKNGQNGTTENRTPLEITRAILSKKYGQQNNPS